VKIPSTIRDPAVLAQRRGELVEVATSLFLERGYHKTSIRDIARACPFNLAALYTYVSSKQDILYLVAQHLVSEIVKALQPAALNHLDPVEGLRLAFETYCQVVDRFSRHIRLLYREIESLPKHARDPILASVQSLIEIFRGLIERAIETGEVRNVDSRLLALDLMVSAHMWALHGRFLRSHLDLKAFADEQSRILFHGVLTARGAEKMVRQRSRPDRARAASLRARR
jgi:TetR/AcrR family transcriptional regulator, cholesterol catabolism regulator